jgi:hypothetical protein
MIRIVILAALALVCLALPAQARQHHRHRHHYHHATAQRACEGLLCIGRDNNPFSGARSINVKMHRVRHSAIPLPRPQQVGYANPFQSFGAGVSRPVRYIAGRLICAVNVQAALAERGIRGTGSALALSCLHWGRSAGGPVPGAAIVSSRRGGGHSAIVSRVVNGVVRAWNATGGQRGWREIPYRHAVLDYRVPGGGPLLRSPPSS